MKRTIIAPLIVLTLGACAADGTPLGTASTTPAPVTAPVAASVETPVIATTPNATTTPVVTAPATIVPATTGTIALAEQVTPLAQRGGNTALAIGATLLGAFIPGPWGGVASIVSGQAGRLALDNYATRTTRYSIRMSDGTVETITRSDPLPLAIGTPVQVTTLADGSKALVQTELALPAPTTSL